MSQVRDRHRLSARLLVGVVCACALLPVELGLAPSAGAAPATHAFDATLSLTGNCEISQLDQVPDPGCPGGPNPPAGRFNLPKDIAIDEYGDIYVVSSPEGSTGGAIDVFDAAGRYLDEIPFPHTPQSVAVDAEGHLYVNGANQPVVRFTPTTYLPQMDQIEYGTTPEEMEGIPLGTSTSGLSVDLANGHLYIGHSNRILEYGSATEGNPLIDAHIGGEIREEYSEVFYSVDSEGHRHELKTERTVDASQVKNRPDVEYIKNGEGRVIEEIELQEAGPVIRQGELIEAQKISVSRTGEIYATDYPHTPTVGVKLPVVVKVLSGSSDEHPVEHVLTGACLPSGHFGTTTGYAADAVLDESSGHIFFDDRSSETTPKNVYEVALNGNGEEECISTLERHFTYPFHSTIGIDNGLHSPNAGTVYVPSGSGQSNAQVYAFIPHIPSPPPTARISFEGVTEEEAVLRATVDPEGAAGTYRLEYVSQAHYEAEGDSFNGAVVAGAGSLPAERASLTFSAPATGLAPGTFYRVRIVAENACETVTDPATECIAEARATLRTYAPAPPLGSCSNQAFRTGLSAALPDCRAYELVTPPSTNSHAPLAPGSTTGPKFGTPPASVDGESVAFVISGGALAGLTGTGSFNGDPYLSTRTSTGWRTEGVGFDGSQSIAPQPGGFSPDHGYSTLSTGSADPGSMVIGGHQTVYVRYPDGSFSPLGEGELATDPGALPLVISKNGTHIVFRSSVELEPSSPAGGTEAIYDRTPDGVVHVVSLLPEELTPAAGENARYLGASTDGSVIPFTVAPTGHESESPLYLRVDDSRTLEIAPAGSTFAGLSASGHYAFYLVAKNLYRYDVETETVEQVTSRNNTTVVNISASGTSVYFVSTNLLTGAEKNPNGAIAQSGKENLYYWDGTKIHFVATVTGRDVEGEVTAGGFGTLDGLGLWVTGLAGGQMAVDPSRSDVEGGVLVFSSRADLTGYESGEVAELYRYDESGDSLTCLSCAPTWAPPTGQAWLMLSVAFDLDSPLEPIAQIPNLSPDGRRVFFQTPDQLVPSDTDGVEDVYEWEADGEGSCATAGGCIYLISSGQSGKPNYLYGASESGNDVFVYTSDLLTSEDHDETQSVYDARVEGGFPSPTGRAAECLGEACQPAASPPTEQTNASSVFEGAGNAKPEGGKKTTCPKGKKPAKQGGKTKCVAKKSKSKKSEKKTQKREKRVNDGKGRSAR